MSFERVTSFAPANSSTRISALLSDKIFGSIDQAYSRDAVLDCLSDFYREFGFRAFCFVIPVITRPNQIQLYERGMPQDWMGRYLRNNYGLIDPIPKATIDHGAVTTLGKLIEQLTPTDVEQAFLDELSQSGLTDGLLVPTTSLYNERGFFGLDSISCGSIARVVAQYSHIRIDRVEFEYGDRKSILSPRE